MGCEKIRPAMQELAQSANLAGPNNKEFLLQAAEEFKSREAWVRLECICVWFLFIAMRACQSNWQNDFHEAIYKATEQKDMPLFVL